MKMNIAFHLFLVSLNYFVYKRGTRLSFLEPRKKAFYEHTGHLREPKAEKQESYREAAWG